MSLETSIGYNLKEELCNLYNQNNKNNQVKDNYDVLTAINSSIDNYFPSIIELKHHSMNGYRRYRVFATEQQEIYNTPDGKLNKSNRDDFEIIGFINNYYFGCNKINTLITYAGNYTITDKIVEIDYENKLIPVCYIVNYIKQKIKYIGLDMKSDHDFHWVVW